MSANTHKPRVNPKNANGSSAVSAKSRASDANPEDTAPFPVEGPLKTGLCLQNVLYMCCLVDFKLQRQSRGGLLWVI